MSAQIIPFPSRATAEPQMQEVLLLDMPANANVAGVSARMDTVRAGMKDTLGQLRSAALAARGNLDAIRDNCRDLAETNRLLAERARSVAHIAGEVATSMRSFAPAH